ncbi:hypothetical protein B2J93_6023 [Marssonina coronariae]|uniref:Uncharacterized protein n=1 Tax=Diplocarpon coronariae TaxID=2795749 RepID=A0A218YZZ0_9HELO|nr:hypothetical protein B2J93_6023 [Marssonina coronariae]
MESGCTPDSTFHPGAWFKRINGSSSVSASGCTRARSPEETFGHCSPILPLASELASCSHLTMPNPYALPSVYLRPIIVYGTLTIPFPVPPTLPSPLHDNPRRPGAGIPHHRRCRRPEPPQGRRALVGDLRCLGRATIRLRRTFQVLIIRDVPIDSDTVPRPSIMSAPAIDELAVPAEKKGRLSRLASRVKTVLKRSNGARRSSVPAKPAAAAASGVPSSASKPSEPVLPTPLEPVAEASCSPSLPQATKILRSQIEAARAKKLAERFAVSVEPVPSGPDKETCRIEKPIRLRVHRACHVCNTSFGSNKTCAQCQHVRCKACPRSPYKKADRAREREKEKLAVPVVAIEPDTYWGLREQLLLTKPNPKPGAQPDNKKYYPDGYPGDAPSPNPSQPVKYKCHKCTKVFPPVPHAAGAETTAPLECLRCKHVRCVDCPRAPPMRIEPVPDPEVLKSVRAKLAALSVGVANS